MDNIEIYKGKVTCTSCGGNSMDERAEIDEYGMPDLCAYKTIRDDKDIYMANCKRCGSFRKGDSYEAIEESTDFLFDCP